MKPEETEVLIKYRMEQALTALDDARYLLEGQRSPQGVSHIRRRARSPVLSSTNANAFNFPVVYFSLTHGW